MPLVDENYETTRFQKDMANKLFDDMNHTMLRMCSLIGDRGTANTVLLLAVERMYVETIASASAQVDLPDARVYATQASVAAQIIHARDVFKKHYENPVLRKILERKSREALGHDRTTAN